jgi:hypothetical protein
MPRVLNKVPPLAALGQRPFIDCLTTLCERGARPNDEKEKSFPPAEVIAA